MWTDISLAKADRDCAFRRKPSQVIAAYERNDERIIVRPETLRSARGPGEPCYGRIAGREKEEKSGQEQFWLTRKILGGRLK